MLTVYRGSSTLNIDLLSWWTISLEVAKEYGDILLVAEIDETAVNSSFIYGKNDTCVYNGTVVPIIKVPNVANHLGTQAKMEFSVRINQLKNIRKYGD